MEYIRQVLPQDSQQILDIYAEYILHTAYTFEIEVPSLEDFTRRIEMISRDYPYLVYMQDDRVLGYAYASRHGERAAFCYNVDVSIYIEKNSHGKGIGSALYRVLFDLLKDQGYYNAFAAISLPNDPSVQIHEKFGFVDAGVHRWAGYKFGQWHDLKWMQKVMIDADIPPRAIIPIKEVLERNGNGIWKA